MALPILHLSGTPYDQGFRHGQALKERIQHNVNLYLERFQYAAQIMPDEVEKRATLYTTVIQAQNPDYHRAMQGIADGSDLSLNEIAILNARYEILYHQLTHLALTGESEHLVDGCTAFAISGENTASGHLLLGQNWDWIPGVEGAILHITNPDGFQMLMFTEAGIVGGKIGLNAAGLGLGLNGIRSTADDWLRMSKPVHVRCYEILQQRYLEAAASVITSTSRSCSTNFILAQAPNYVANIEAAPEVFNRYGWQDGCVVHANHFVDPEGSGIHEPPNKYRPYSQQRQQQLTELITQNKPLFVSDMQTSLRNHENHPQSVCRHPDPSQPPHERIITITSVVMDLNDRTMHVTDGAPCEKEFQLIAL